ncbi:MAG: hypothetical protein WBH44_10735 [Proteocatella sp.]
MKKKLALLMTMMLMATSLVGCSSEQKSYFDETQKMSKWESTESNVTGKMMVKVAMPSIVEEGKEAVEPELKYETINVDFDAKGYTLLETGKELKGLVTMNLKSDNEFIDIKDVKIFIDGDKVYISKNYFEGIITSAGGTIPEKVKQMKQEYILMDGSVKNAMMTDEELMASSEYQAMTNYIETITSPEKRDDMMVKMSKVMEIVDFDVPVTKAGRTYTMQLGSDQILEKALKSMDNIVNNTEEILKIMELQTQLNITKEDIASLQKEYNATGKTEAIKAFATAKEMIKGSSITSKESFEDDSYSSDMKLVLSVKDTMSAEMTIKQTAKKVAKQEVNVPKIENSIDMNKYMEALMPEPAVETVPAIEMTPAMETTPVVKPAAPVFIAAMPAK